MRKRDTQAHRKCTGESRFSYLEILSTNPFNLMHLAFSGSVSFMIWSISIFMVDKILWVPKRRYLFWFHTLYNGSQWILCNYIVFEVFDFICWPQLHFMLISIGQEQLYTWSHNHTVAVWNFSVSAWWSWFRKCESWW